MIKRVINTSFWTDDEVVNSFTPDDRYFYCYLMTNPHTSQLGVYHLPKVHAILELGWDSKKLETMLDRFEKLEKIKVSNKTNEIAIKNYLKHSIVKGGKPVLNLLIKEAKDVRDKELLDWVINNVDIHALNPTATAFANWWVTGEIREDILKYDNKM